MSKIFNIGVGGGGIKAVKSIKRLEFLRLIISALGQMIMVITENLLKTFLL